jgi:hypothetical protein
MSAETAPAPPPDFRAGAILALVMVGVVAFASLAVLSAFAPELRSGDDGRTHALSRSAVGFAGAVILERKLGAQVLVSRAHPSRLADSLLVLTPDPGKVSFALTRFPKARHTLIVLPKWIVLGDPVRPGRVRKLGPFTDGRMFERMLSEFAKTTAVARRTAVSRARLTGPGWTLVTGPIDRLATLSGEGWTPVVTDERGAAVVASPPKRPDIWVLADPDLLNNQGLRALDTARAGAALLDTGRGGDGPIVFDVTLNGLERGRGIGRTLLEPPWLAGSLIGAAAAVLMGLHALARFGQPRQGERAFALGARALVDNSAGLVRMARRQPEMAPPYAALTEAAIGRAVGNADRVWLAHLARRRGLAEPAELEAEAAAARTTDDLVEVARKLYRWKLEMTRERD